MLGVVRQWGFTTLRTTGGLVYPSGFMVRYGGRRWAAEDLPLLALSQQTRQEQADCYLFLEAVAEDLHQAGPRMREQWGMDVGADLEDAACERMSDEMLEFKNGLRSLYIAIEGLRTVAVAGQRVERLREAPVGTRLYLTGELDTSYRPLHPELRESRRFLFTSRPKNPKKPADGSVPVLSLSNDALEQVLGYTKGAMYRITDVPMHLVRDHPALQQHLSSQHFRIRAQAYNEELAEYPEIDWPGL